MIGDKIKKRREELGLTQVQLEVLTGIGHRMISAYEKGTSKPNDEIIRSLMKALDCDANYLFEYISSDGINCNNKISSLSDLSENEQRMINAFKKLNSTQQGELIGRAELMIEQSEADYREEDIG